MSSKNYRLYSFVAHHYLSPLQQGLQTAHVVSELFVKAHGADDNKHKKMLNKWASKDKTIIICGVGNNAGVLTAFEKLSNTCDYAGVDLPFALFNEDAGSMNNMATACGVLVPEIYWSAKYKYDATALTDKEYYVNGSVLFLEGDGVHFDFIDMIKNAKLA